MTRREKLVDRFKSIPSNFTWTELTKLLRSLGYEEYEGHGSRTKFRGEGLPLLSLHRPHPKPIVRKYAIKQILETLQEAKLI